MNEIINGENIEFILENLTRTLLYEGYALYPYYRSAIKNQKPIPFGVIFPKDYNAFHEHSHSNMQSQCIVTGSDNLTLNIDVRFLHLRKTELFEYNKNENDYVPVFNLEINGNIYQAGWQTIERKIIAGNLTVSELINNGKTIPVQFDKANEGEIILNEQNEATAQSIVSVSEIKGSIKIDATPVEDMPGSFRITVAVTNNTRVPNGDTVSRDEALAAIISFNAHNIAKPAG